jgi:predicted metalloprotease
MKWTPGSVSEDVEDRRGGGGGFRGGPVSIGTFLVLLVLTCSPARTSCRCSTGTSAGWRHGAPSNRRPGPELAGGRKARSVRLFVLDDAQHTWQQILPASKAKLVLFRDATPTACGMGETASGPFYCPGDERLSRSRLLRRVAHAVRRVSVISRRHASSRTRSDITCSGCGASKAGCGSCRSRVQAVARRVSVRLELQADCYAGSGAIRPRSATSSSRATSRAR